MNSDIISLPWPIQLSLASGYAAYAIAFAGVRSHHQTIDIAFRTLVFGAIATVALQLSLTSFRLNEFWAGLVAAGSALLAGAIWRAFGRSFFAKILRASNLSAADDEPSAFTKIYSDTKHHATQAIVTLKDGTELHCRDTSKFHDAAITPLTIGLDGSIALYVTHKCYSTESGTWNEEDYPHVRDTDWGDQITLVPASNVSAIKLRFLPRKPTS